jgi:hypothetical protein
MGLADVVNKMKSEIADIGSRAMTGKTIEERVNDMFVQIMDNKRKER